VHFGSRPLIGRSWRDVAGAGERIIGSALTSQSAERTLKVLSRGKMLTKITGLRGQDPLRMQVEWQINRLGARRPPAPRAVRVAFFDDDGPRGGLAIRCALTLTPARGPVLRVQHTARTYSAAFKGALTILTRKLKRSVQRRRRRTRYPRRRSAEIRARLAQ
jgi:hypothetical protein